MYDLNFQYPTLKWLSDPVIVRKNMYMSRNYVRFLGTIF